MICVISIHTALHQKLFNRYNDNSDLEHHHCFHYIWCSIRHMLNCIKYILDTVVILGFHVQRFLVPA